jgi:hypothetical protein
MEEANHILTGILPNRYRVGISNEEDFVLQINQPRTSAEVEGVRMNYLTKWSTLRFQVLNVSIAMGVAGVAMPTQETQEFIAAGLTFDNNNKPVNVPLTREQQSSLLSEGLRASEEMQRTIGLRFEGF